MTYTLRLTTTAALCALTVYAIYLYGMVLTYSEACTSVACQVFWM